MLFLRIPIILITLAGTLSYATPTYFIIRDTNVLNTITQDFNGTKLKNTGTANTAFPIGWFANENTTVLDKYAAGDGTSLIGDIYSFGATGSTERALGTLRANPQTGAIDNDYFAHIGVAFSNQTGRLIDNVTISYTGEQWRLGAQGRTDKLLFSYSYDATDLFTGTWFSVSALDFIAPNQTGAIGALDGNANSTVLSYTLSGLNFADQGNLLLRWFDFDASGADDGLAVDNFSISVPEHSSSWTLAMTLFGLFAVASSLRNRATRT
jgi:hypothetical protein